MIGRSYGLYRRTPELLVALPFFGALVSSEGGVAEQSEGRQRRRLSSPARTSEQKFGKRGKGQSVTAPHMTFAPVLFFTRRSPRV